MAEDRKLPSSAGESIVPDDVSRESAVHATEDKVDRLIGNHEQKMERVLNETAEHVKENIRTLDEVLEYAVTAAAEGLLANSKALEGVNNNLQRMKESNRFHIALLTLVLLLAATTTYSLVHYTVPNSERLVDCTTPSTPSHKHACSDRSAKTGFDLSTAIVRCTKDLPAVVHTDEVKACLFDSLGIKAQYTPQP